MLAISSQIEAVDSGASNASLTIKKLESAIKSIETIASKKESIVSNSTEGAMLFLLAHFSHFFCTSRHGATSFDLWGSQVARDPIPSRSKSFSSTLVRPSSIEQMVSLVNMWVLGCIATGLSNSIGLLIFLEDVLYEPLRSGTHEWPVAFESMILYLRMVEAHAGSYALATVKHACGGMDSIKREATVIAEERYAFMRRAPTSARACDGDMSWDSSSTDSHSPRSIALD